MKTKLDLNKLFKNRGKKLPSHTITTTVYYKDDPEKIFEIGTKGLDKSAIIKHVPQTPKPGRRS